MTDTYCLKDLCKLRCPSMKIFANKQPNSIWRDRVLIDIKIEALAKRAGVILLTSCSIKPP